MLHSACAHHSPRVSVSTGAVGSDLGGGYTGSCHLLNSCLIVWQAGALVHVALTLQHADYIYVMICRP